MKIGCECGSTIHDITDDIPYKAHFVPDQAWSTMWDRFDEVFNSIETGEISRGEASMAGREIFRDAGLRQMWQCESCGRLYVGGLKNALLCFEPAILETDKKLLAMPPPGTLYPPARMPPRKAITETKEPLRLRIVLIPVVSFVAGVLVAALTIVGR
jgi:hypothetical protein